MGCGDRTHLSPYPGSLQGRAWVHCHGHQASLHCHCLRYGRRPAFSSLASHSLAWHRREWREGVCKLKIRLCSDFVEMTPQRPPLYLPLPPSAKHSGYTSKDGFLSNCQPHQFLVLERQTRLFPSHSALAIIKVLEAKLYPQ